LENPVVAPLVRDFTIGELSGGRSTSASNGSKPSGTAGAARRTAKAGTRTAEGRKDYYAKVLAAIKGAGKYVAAEEVIKSIGGTGLQFRTATNGSSRRARSRLAERGTRT
jgi:hypothetical protein